MKVLGLDTATLTCGIAVLDDDRVLAEARHDASHRTNDLLVGIDRVCREAGVAPTALDAIAIGAGPGSFTGLRIGMATAKGIAFAAGRPLWAVSSLAALAHDARAAGAADGLADAVIVSVLDARRQEVFAGAFRATDLAPLGEERVLPPAELAPWLATLAPAAVAAGALRYAGDALAAHPDALGALAPAWTAIRTPSGAAIAHLARGGARADILVGGAPTYIRPSEAEVMYPDGVPGALVRR